MKRRTMRAIAVLFIMVFMMNHISMNALAATSSKEKAAVKAQVVKLMKNVKAYNESGIVKCFQPRRYRKSFSLLDQKSKFAATIRQVHQKYLDYEIVKVTVKGKRANVRVDVTYYDLYYVYKDAFWDMVLYNTKHPGSINDGNMEAKIYTFMNKAIRKNKTYPVTKITCCIPLVKRNGKWVIEKMTKNMDRCIGCRYAQSIMDMAK